MLTHYTNLQVREQAITQWVDGASARSDQGICFCLRHWLALVLIPPVALYIYTLSSAGGDGGRLGKGGDSDLHSLFALLSPVAAAQLVFVWRKVDAIYGVAGGGFRDTNGWPAWLTANAFPGFYAGDHFGTFNWWLRLLTGSWAAWGWVFGYSALGGQCFTQRREAQPLDAIVQVIEAELNK